VLHECSRFENPDEILIQPYVYLELRNPLGHGNLLVLGVRYGAFQLLV
jgi:hypothetical protein